MANEKRLIMCGEKCTLDKLRPGTIFAFGDDCIAVKSEYRCNNGLIEAFIVDSGEQFWGGVHTAKEQNELMVQPLEIVEVDAVEVVRKPVRGYEEHYVVDQFGRVYGIERTVTVVDGGRVYEKIIAEKQMKQSLHTKGYKTVTLTKDGKSKTRFVHRIVAEAFIDNPDDLPMVNHKDEDKTNNFVENLEWCTASYNRTYGKAVEKHAKTLRGRKHTEEHKQKISESMNKHFAEMRKDHFCSYGERREA